MTSPTKSLSIALVAAALVLAPAGAASAAASPSPSASAAGNVLRVPMSGSEVDSLNPFVAVFQASLDILNLEYPAMAASMPPDGATGGDLAKGWKVDGDTWTFTLRKDLKWSDGRPLTAADVAWTYNAVMKNQSLAVANGSITADLKSVTATDDTTVKIVTNSPTGVNPGGLPIVPEHVWSKIKDPAKFANDKDSVVSGPFQLKTYKTGVQAYLAANPNYYGGKPNIDGVLFINYKNSDAEVLALKNGEIDLVGGMTPAQFDSLKKADGITTKEVPSMHFWDLSLNPGTETTANQPIGDGNAVLKDLTVRTAIREALNDKQLVQKVIGGYGSTGPEIITPGNKVYYSNYTDIADGYDPDKANAALDAAGYKKGADGYRVDTSGKAIDLRLLYNASSTANTETAQFIVPWLKTIGIKVTLSPSSWDVMSPAISKGDYDMYISGWGEGQDPDYMMYINTCDTRAQDSSGANNASEDNWCDPQYDKLYQAAKQATDQKDRVKAVHAAMAVHYKSAVANLLYYDDSLEAYSSRLTNLTPIAGDNLNTISYAHLKLATASADASHSGLVWIIVGIVVLLALIAAVIVVLRRRSTAAERE